MNKINGTLLYVCLDKPVKAYVKAGEAAKPDEWKASIAVVDEDTVDAFEDYAKSVDAKISLKKVKATEFEAIYKCPVPEGAGKNVWVFTFRKSTELGKTGKPVPEAYRPRVLERKGNTLVDVTHTKLPANGSIGALSIDPFTRTDGTSSLYLKNVLVTEMIEYVRQESNYEPGSEFNEDDTPADVEVKKVTKEEVAERSAPKADKPAARKPAKAPAEDDGSPF